MTPTDDTPPPAAPPKKGGCLRGCFINVLVLGIAGLISFALAELAVRLIMPQQLIMRRADIWRPADSVGWDHLPLVNTTVNTGERTVDFLTDAEGFRVGAAGRTESGTRVLLIGDSFMEALQVPYESSTAGRLEHGLAERMRHPVAVRNAAVGGWDPPQYLQRMRMALARDSFQAMVVVIYVGNDVVTFPDAPVAPRLPTPETRLRIPRSLSFGELVASVLYPINNALETRSHLFVLLKNNTKQIRMRMGLSPEFFPLEYRRREATSPRWDNTADLLQRLAAEAAARGTPAVFVMVPPVFQVDSTLLAGEATSLGIPPESVDVNQPTRLLGSRLESRGLTVVDLVPALRAAHGRGAVLYGSIDRHFSPAGHQVLADTLVPLVAGAIERRGRPPQRRSR